MNHSGELFLGLMIAITLLSVVARRIGVPYPVLLVLGGLGLGFLPGLPDVRLNPDLVLLIFLPPLLYGAAFFSSLRDLRAAIRPISLLAIGLVVVTTCAVAVIAHALIDGMPWAAAFALGAIVSPTDPLAVSTISRRLGVPRSIVTILEGESLVNDGTGLTVYSVAVAAALGGSFSLWDAGLQFFVDTAGGAIIGLAVGFLVSAIRKPLDDPPVEVVISLATGYLAYLPAQELGLSGVLAAVTAGIYLAWSAPIIASPQMRMQGNAVWEVLTFLLNAILFVLIGLQLPVILDGLQGARPFWTLIGYAGAVCATVVGARLLWMYTVPPLIRVLDPRLRRGQGRSTWRSRLVVGWSGIRGAVSMAAALALPLRFPTRDLILFLAFAVILFTLVVQGLTLPALIRSLSLEEDDEEEREEVHARRAAADAALERLGELEGEAWTRDETVERVRALYEYRRRRFQARADGDGTDRIEERSAAYQRLQRELLEAQRHALLRLRSEREISDDVMRKVQHDIDLEDTRLEI